MDFIDRLLLLLWAIIVGMVALGLVFTIVPALQQAATTLITAELAFSVSAFAFLITSTGRFLVNKDANDGDWFVTMATSYSLTLLGYAALVTQQLLQRPSSYLVGAIVPACFMAVVSVPARYVWNKIKPLGNGKRVAIPKRRL
jgi:hypothetical protein